MAEVKKQNQGPATGVTDSKNFKLKTYDMYSPANMVEYERVNGVHVKPNKIDIENFAERAVSTDAAFGQRKRR